MRTLDSKPSALRYKEDFLRIGDLINFEGPELTIFEHSGTGTIFLFDWVDQDATHNRWLIYEVKAKDVLEFYFKKITHLKLFQCAVKQTVYFIDLNNKVGFSNIPVFELASVPTEYLPNAVNFDSVDCPRQEVIKSFLMDKINSQKQENHYQALSTIEVWGINSLFAKSSNTLSNPYLLAGTMMNSKITLPVSTDQLIEWADISVQIRQQTDPRIFATPIKENNAYALAC